MSVRSHAESDGVLWQELRLGFERLRRDAHVRNVFVVGRADLREQHLQTVQRSRRLSEWNLQLHEQHMRVSGCA
jgi:hypothetical protein